MSTRYMLGIVAPQPSWWLSGSAGQQCRLQWLHEISRDEVCLARLFSAVSQIVYCAISGQAAAASAMQAPHVAPNDALSPSQGR